MNKGFGRNSVHRIKTVAGNCYVEHHRLSYAAVWCTHTAQIMSYL
jgi:hypothetical protein